MSYRFFFIEMMGSNEWAIFTLRLAFNQKEGWKEAKEDKGE